METARPHGETIRRLRRQRPWSLGALVDWTRLSRTAAAIGVTIAALFTPQAGAGRLLAGHVGERRVFHPQSGLRDRHAGKDRPHDHNHQRAARQGRRGGGGRPLHVEHLPIADLHPDPLNPRRIAEGGLAALCRSIETFGLVDPILARRADRRLIAGHQRLVAARRAGLTTVPVILLDLTAEDARLLYVALNRIGGEWDQDLLARLLIDLRAPADRDLTLSGFAEADLQDLLTRFDQREKRARPERFDLDEALAAYDREASGIAPGAGWRLGAHRLFQGDATDAAVLARCLGDTPAAWSSPTPPTT